MDELLDEYENGEGRTISTNSIALKYGLIAGAVCILVRLIAYQLFQIDYSSPETMMSSSVGQSSFTYIATLAFIAVIILAVKKHSDAEGRGFSLGRGFGTGTLTGVYAAVIIALFTFVYYKFIDTSMIEGMASFMDEAINAEGGNDEGVETAKSIMGTILSPGMLAVGELLKSAIGAMIPALIGAAIFKKD